jgi:hypothetical protein
MSVSATLAVTAQNLGHNVSNFTINKSSIRRNRIVSQKRVAHTVKEECSPSNVPLTEHRGSKILLDITECDSVNRLAIPVSGSDVDQLFVDLEKQQVKLL